jgi:HEPN pEK499 p136
MNIEDPIKDLARRTVKNLETLETVGSLDGGVFEVTQLTNSLLSLIIIPQAFGTPMYLTPQNVDAHFDGSASWPDASVRFLLESRGRRIPQTTHKLLQGLRNAVAHHNVNYLTNVHNHIEAIEFTEKVQRRSDTLLVCEVRSPTTPHVSRAAGYSTRKSQDSADTPVQRRILKS